MNKLIRQKQVAYNSTLANENFCSSLTSQAVLKSASLSVYNLALKEFNVNKVRCGGHAPALDKEN